MSLRKRAAMLVAVLAAGIAFAGISQCSAFSGTSNDTNASSDAGDSGDASVLDATISQTPNAFGAAENWSVVSMATVTGLDGGGGFYGGAFDGKYLYLVGQGDVGPGGGPFMRHDTSRPITQSSSWEAFDAGQDIYFGAAYDGTHVIFAGEATRGGAPLNALLEFDPTGSFADASSWTKIPVSSTEAVEAVGIARGASAAYFASVVPPYSLWSLPTDPEGAPLEFVQSSVSGYCGGVFANGAMYFAPCTGNFVKFDPTAGNGAVTEFDYLSATDAGGTSYFGAVTDGHYVYYVPYEDTVAGAAVFNSRIVRFDTTRSITDVTAYDTFTISDALDASAARGYFGGAFDGRFIYFAPHENEPVVPTANSIVARYDTTQPFAVASSWELFDMHTISGAASAGFFAGAVFDGKNICFIPEYAPAPFLVCFNAWSQAVALPSGVFAGAP